MVKSTVTVFMIGTLLGAIAGYGSLRAIQKALPAYVGEVPEARGNITRAEPRKASLVDARLTALRAAYELRDIPSAEEAIERLANTPPSPDRDTELEALLLRFLEMDPQRAVRFALALSLSRRFIVPMFKAWASVDSNLALAELARIQDSGLRRSVAIELVGLIARSEGEIEQLAALSGMRNPRGFVVDALAQLASYEPLSAFRQGMNLPSFSLKLAAVERIGKEWAQFDAPAALSYVSSVSEPLFRNMFHAAVVTEWISFDPDRALEYLVRPEGRRLLSTLPLDMVSSIAEKLAIHRPDETVAAVAAMGNLPGQALSYRAKGRLVERDLSAAIAHMDALPEGAERRELIELIGFAYARKDPEGALAWARTVDEMSAAGAINAVISQIARADPLRAIDHALESGNVFSSLLNAERLSGLTADEVISVADKLVTAEHSQQRALDRLMQSWPQRDSSGAWDWLVRQGSISAITVQSAANGFASNGIVIPTQSIYQLSDGLRDDWVVNFASTYAQTQPDAAIEWLRTLRSDPAYDEWAIAVVDRLARPGGRGDPMLPLFPRPAAAILRTIQMPPRNSVATVATSWALEEPIEALRWASTFVDPEIQTAGVAAAIGAWTIDDPDAARRSVLNMPGGEMRDRALVAQLAQQVSSHGSIDQVTVDAFGSRDEFQDVVASNSSAFFRAFTWLGSRDPDAVRILLDRHIEDEEYKQSILDGVAAIRANGWQRHKDSILNIDP